jgi:spore coat polysaccharide biosynthesis protein SpsF (cytidylyltransferase family)
MVIDQTKLSLGLSVEIIEKHQISDFPIQELPNWQQEIILKAINKTPELFSIYG